MCAHLLGGAGCVVHRFDALLDVLLEVKQVQRQVDPVDVGPRGQKRIVIGSCCLPQSNSSRSGTVRVASRSAVSAAVATCLNGSAAAGAAAGAFRSFHN